MMKRGNKSFEEALRELNEALTHWDDFSGAMRWHLLEEALLALVRRHGV